MPFISRQQQVTDNGWGRGVSSPRRVLLSGPDSQGLWMWTMAEEKGSGWELWESRETIQREQRVHVTAGLVLEECHIGKVCFWGCLCSPLSEKQCCQAAPGSLQMHRASPGILPRTALCRQCSHLKISPGPCYHSAVPHPSATELLEVLV